MADKSQRLIWRLEADNGKLIKKLAESERRFQSAGKNIGGSVGTINTSLSRASTGAANFGKAANDARGAMSGVGRRAGQLGTQFSQLTGQIQGGQNAMLAISQQAQDIGFVLGPTGALVGAIISIGAALSMSLVSGLFESTDALKKLDIAFEGVNAIIKETKGNLVIITDEFSDLSKSANQLSQAKIKIALSEINDALSASKAEAVGLAKALSPSELGGLFTKTWAFVGTTTARLEEGKISLEEYAKRVSKLFVEGGESSKEFRDSLKKILTLTEKSNKLREAQKQIEEGLGSAVSETRAAEIEKEAEALEKASQASLEFYNANSLSVDNKVFSIEDSLRSNTQVLQDNFNENIAILRAYKAKYVDEVQYANNLELQLEQEKADALQQIALSSAASVLGGFASFTKQIEGMAKEGSAAQKALFLVNQGIAAASAVIKGFQTAAATRLAFAELAAATANPALIGVGESMATAQVGMGFATAGMIAGQTLASFEGGGYTGPGSRSGGMDGKGGMLAMLHPNEIVTDLTKESSGANIQVINNVSNAKVRPEVDRDGVVRIIIDELGNQSSRSRSALHQTSNVTPKGSR